MIRIIPKISKNRFSGMPRADKDVFGFCTVKSDIRDIDKSEFGKVISMSKCKEYISSCPDNPPEWYWIYGLHDACIMQIESFEFPFDYNKFIGEKSKYNRNCLALKIDAKGALYDNSVKEIRFYNYKVLTEHISLHNRKEVWWLADRLSDQGDFYTLEIDLQDLNSYPEDFTIKIKFDRAEVCRE